MNSLRSVTDINRSTSLASSLRRRRFQFFLSLVEPLFATLDRPLTILDAGGTAGFWRREDLDFERIDLTVLNLEPSDEGDSATRYVVGDARDMSQFATRSFDVVFSNSVIEHVGDFRDQERMANEVRRIGRNYYVQTPNFWFPIEPHFLFPGFQWLPLAARASLIRRWDLGHLDREPDVAAARAAVEGIRLLKRHEVARLFPESHIWREPFLGLTKSFVAYRFEQCGAIGSRPVTA